MNAGKDHDRQDKPSPSGPAQDGTEPVSVPENADFRYDEQEARDPGINNDPHGQKPEA